MFKDQSRQIYVREEKRNEEKCDNFWRFEAKDF